MNNEELKKQLVDLLIKAHVTMGPHSVVDYLIDSNVNIQKIAKWIDSDPLEWECSNCHYKVERWNNTLYCPSCGAKMIEVQLWKSIIE